VWRADDLADCSILLIFEKMRESAAAVTVAIGVLALCWNRTGSCKVIARSGSTAAIRSHRFDYGEPAASFIGARIASGHGRPCRRDYSHERFEAKRNNHQEAYRLDGARTDMAEGCFSRLRRAEIDVDPAKILVKAGSVEAETALGMISPLRGGGVNHRPRQPSWRRNCRWMQERQLPPPCSGCIMTRSPSASHWVGRCEACPPVDLLTPPWARPKPSSAARDGNSQQERDQK
jgi:hypothetical protein